MNGGIRPFKLVRPWEGCHFFLKIIISANEAKGAKQGTRPNQVGLELN